MITLRIFLMGLVALVPSHDGKDLTILLPAMDGHHRHFPVIVFPCGGSPSELCEYTSSDGYDLGRQSETVWRALNLPEDNWSDEGKRLLHLLDGYFGAVVLEGESLTVEDLQEGDLTLVRDLRKARATDRMGRGPRNRLEAQDLAWVPSLKSFAPHAAVAHRRHLETPDRSLVAAQIRLVGVEGSVKVDRLHQVEVNRVPRIRTYKFCVPDPRTTEPGGGEPACWETVGEPQAVATLLELELSVRGDLVQLVAEPFASDDRGRAARSLELKPPPVTGPGPKVIEILIGNLTPVQRLLGSGHPDQLRPDLEGPDPHFNRYYALSTYPGEPRPIPFLSDRTFPATGVNFVGLPPSVEVVSRAQRDFAGSSSPSRVPDDPQEESRRRAAMQGEGMLQPGISRAVPSADHRWQLFGGVSRPICSKVELSPP